jgi:hypothetical protein
MASLTPGSSVPQVFDHLSDRNLDVIRRYRDDLEGPAQTSFPHSGQQPAADPAGDPSSASRAGQLVD